MQLENVKKLNPDNPIVYIYSQKLNSTCDMNGNFSDKFQFLFPLGTDRLLDITYVFRDILAKKTNVKGLLSLSDSDYRYLELKIVEYFQNKNIAVVFNSIT